jgi:hypothetical protein
MNGMVNKLILVMLASSLLAGPGILLAANQLQFGGTFQPLIATALILAGLAVPFAAPRN